MPFLSFSEQKHVIINEDELSIQLTFNQMVVMLKKVMLFRYRDG